MALRVSITSTSTRAPVPSDVQQKLHHNKHGKGFVNPWDSYIERSGLEIGRLMTWRALTGKRKTVDISVLPCAVVKPSFLPSRETKTLRATWLGHACHYIEFPNGMRVLTDPVFTQRCSPSNYIGPKRYTEMPCDVEEIPIIDAVIISHNHYDHLSQPTIHAIAQKHKDVQFFVPLGNKSWFENEGLKNVTELDWWEDQELRLSGETAEETDIVATITCLPCQHTSARTAFDKAHTLWASWAVEAGGKKVWFGGDTGYRTVPELPEDEFDYADKYAHLPHCPAFKDIGELRGPFDLGLIPIGAYDPRFIMSPMHANPYDSVNIFIDTKCKRALGIHWGTWTMGTEEPISEPPRVLKDALKWKSLDESVFETCDIGESREY